MAQKPDYAPNTVNQTVGYGGATWRGQPGGDWQMVSSSGDSNVDLNAPVAAAQNQYGRLKDIFAAQRGEEQGFLNNYAQTIKNQPTMSAIAERLGNELGLPALQQNATTLRTTLQNIPYTYGSATTGADVNANQLQRIIGQKASELAPTVTAAENALSSAQGQLTTRLGYETAQQQKELLPFEMGASFMGQRLARETSGYTSAMQSELSAIIAKMQSGVQISEGEKNRAQELAVAEQNYRNQLSLQQNQQSFTTREREAGQKFQLSVDPLGLGL